VYRCEGLVGSAVGGGLYRRSSMRVLARVRGVLGDAKDLSHEQNERRRLSSLLVGLEVPWVLLDGFLATELAVRSGVVVYVYPGVGCSPDGGENSAMLDVVQHRAYDAVEKELAALDLFVVGVSGQPGQRSQRPLGGSEVRHMLLGDPKFLLAENLGLPTFEEDGVRGYRRLTLLIRRGTIGKVSYPVRSPETDPAQAIAWIKAQES
jgi:peroxiredoxin